MQNFVNNNTSLSKQAADYLIEWIKKSGLNPGDKLPTEAELAEKLNIGRSTVREAIIILKSRNIVEIHRGKGTYISEEPGLIEDPFGLDLVEDRMQAALDWGVVRLIIEPAVAELAARNATEEDIRKIREKYNDLLSDLEQGYSHRRSDIAFHDAIAEASHNTAISKVAFAINDSINRYMEEMDDNDTPEARAYHRQLFHALEEHNPEAAKEAAKQLILLNQSILEKKQEK